MADPVNDSIKAISGVSDKLTPLLNKAVVAVLILLVGLILGKLLGNLLRRTLNELQLDKHLRSSGLNFSLEKLLSNIISYIIYFIAVVMSLNSLGLTTAILNMISAAVIIIIVISFVLAVKDFFPNLIAGLRLKSRKLFEEGDEIQIKEVRGRISSIGFLETRLITRNKEEVIMPNSIFIKRQVVIRKKSGKKKKALRKKRK